VSEWLPTASVEIVRTAVPLLRVTVPRLVAPSLKVTEPVALDGVTVAVQVTVCRYVEGFGEQARVVDEVALFTTCVTTLEVLPL
jgi:hypothetical protein